MKNNYNIRVEVSKRNLPFNSVFLFLFFQLNVKLVISTQSQFQSQKGFFPVHSPDPTELEMFVGIIMWCVCVHNTYSLPLSLSLTHSHSWTHTHTHTHIRRQSRQTKRHRSLNLRTRCRHRIRMFFFHLNVTHNQRGGDPIVSKVSFNIK